MSQRQQRSGLRYHCSHLLVPLMAGLLFITLSTAAQDLENATFLPTSNSSSASQINATSLAPSALPSKLENVTFLPTSITTNTSSPTPAESLVPSFSPSIHHGTACAAYTEGRYEYTPDTGPFPISCSNRSFYKWGPPEHEALACCSDAGRVSVQLAQVGGFDIVYKYGTAVPTPMSTTSKDTTQQQEEATTTTATATELDYRCVAYTEALRAVVCDPRQYLMVHRTQNLTRLRICQSSCSAVFQNCGLPGVNYPSDANYTDGRSLCESAWGGWNTTPCEANDQQWACRGLDGLEIVNDIENNDDSSDSNVPCLSIIYPTDNTLKAYKATMRPPDACSSRFQNGLTMTTIIIIVVSSIVSTGIVGVLLLKLARNRQAAQERDMS